MSAELPPLVLDASALAALAFGESQAPALAARLANRRLLAPQLLVYELASVCVKKLRTDPTQRAALLAAFEDALALPVELCSVDAAALPELAEARRLSTYDAAYLWLAVTRQAELVTLDTRLAAAAST